jgi:hypothetical protein
LFVVAFHPLEELAHKGEMRGTRIDLNQSDETDWRLRPPATVATRGMNDEDE